MVPVPDKKNRCIWSTSISRILFPALNFVLCWWRVISLAAKKEIECWGVIIYLCDLPGSSSRLGGKRSEPLRLSEESSPLFGLAPDGVYPARVLPLSCQQETSSQKPPGGLLPRHFTLTRHSTSVTPTRNGIIIGITFPEVSVTSFRAQIKFECRAVSFLWHFPSHKAFALWVPDSLRASCSVESGLSSPDKSEAITWPAPNTPKNSTHDAKSCFLSPGHYPCWRTCATNGLF